jgi:hypothetical protein
MENIIEELDDEFDIQPSVLKKRNKNVEQPVYVEYDRINNTVVSVSPVTLEPSNKRNVIQKVDQSELTNNLFNNKISLSKVIIKKNKETDKFELEYNKPIIKSEFDYVFATTMQRSFIHIDVDVVTKNLEVKFDYEMFNNLFGSENLLEKDLSEYPEEMVVYCIDRRERSKLFGTVKIDIETLFKYHSIRMPARWLPNEEDKLKNFGFVYYNNNQKISVASAPKIIEKETIYKSNILYKQHGNVLKLQSNMQNIMAFHVGEDIILYSYSKYNPAKMLGSYKVSRDQFNNYNYFEINMKTDEPVRLISNCFHLQLEESNVYSN